MRLSPCLRGEAAKGAKCNKGCGEKPWLKTA